MRLLKLVGVAVVTLVAAVVTAGGASASGSQPSEATFTVTIRNLTTGQYLTPPNYAAHTDAVRVFERRTPASAGVQDVAENGNVPTLAAELLAKIDDQGLGVSGVGAADPIGPGGEATFELTTTADRFSLVAMVICTNDGFAGLDSKRLPARDGQTRSFRVQAWDAGTEINTELREDLVPAPFCGPGDGSTMSNPALAENGVIRTHRTLLGVGDLDPSLDWEGPVMKITVTRD